MDPEQEASRRVGTTLCNKWTLEKLLGTGGMAAVYVAVHKIGRREAIKILHPDIARAPELRARFEQEAHAVNRFRHPGAVEIRDIDVAEDGSPFLVMELLEGDPLSDLARRPGGVPLPDLLRLVDEMLDVLAAAHAQGIIHRDIKPDNLFVLRDGRLKVLDFGIARVRAGASPKLLTRRGAALGTAPYMPPEQIKGHEIDARADLFAVGATMFRLIAKRRIHHAENETETRVTMASEPAPRLASVSAEAPPDVCVVVDRALMFDREQRYPDAITMQRDVRALREGMPPPYAHARLLEGTPAPSALRVPSVIQPPISPGSFAAGPVSGDGPTAYADEAASPATGRSAMPMLETTAAASPVAIHVSVSRGPASSAAPTLDRATVPYNGAAQAAAAAPSSSLEQPLPEATPPSTGVLRPPGASSTLRSAFGNAGPSSQRFVGPASTQVMATPPSVSAPTRPVGAAPLAPGATVPVVDRRAARSFAEREPNLALLVLVGIAFAAIGVGLTLWIMLRASHDNPSADAGAAASDAPEPPEAWPTAAPRRTGAPRTPIPPPQPRNPAQPQPQPFFPGLPGFTPAPPNTSQPAQTAPPQGQDRPDKPDRPGKPDKPGKGRHGKKD